MLGKLIKHEWIATSRRYSLLYLVLAAITVFAALIHALPIEHTLFKFGEAAVLIVYGISLFAAFLVGCILYIVRFYKNMVSDEGYLTFTLPAKVEQLVLSKFIVALAWDMITLVVVTISLFCVFILGHVELSEVFEVCGKLSDMFGPFLVVFPIMLLASEIYKIFLYYLSIAIGQMFGNYKILASILADFVVSFALSLGVMIITLGVCAVVGFIETAELLNTVDGMAKFYGFTSIFMAGIAVVEYFVTCYLLKKKLNLV